MILDTINQGFVTLVVFLWDTLIPIFRKIRFFILLPFTPILKPLTKHLFSCIDVKVDSDVKSRPDICILDDRFYARFWADQMIGYDEMYVEGWWTTENMTALYKKIMPFLSRRPWIVKVSISYWEGMLRWGVLNTGREGHNFSAPPEYDLPVEYFKLITDKAHMQHSSGYYAHGARSYAEAQVAKLHLIAAKLELKAGMTLLDLGCGFGGLAKFMADNYGVTVVGVTVCESMAKKSAEHCRGSKVTIKAQDWRRVEGKFDRITVIEMLEHVGKHNYDEFFGKIESLLKPGGRILLQHYFVKRGVPNFVEFFCKYQFGQVYFPDMHEFVEPCCRHLRFANTQDITLDADLTYQHYIDMLEANRDEMEAVAGPKVWRACRLTYATAGAMLTTRNLLVYHTVLVRRDDQTRVPLAQ
ncbi:cyclopropane-fatty-acyl-phospholipid synthase-like [Folsomia candida]|uniref:cyclopropane-fatty-acyl-phospholipid synthase-like n=1 Tax=Folsomia candida TaxID=158441 RepID=UPI001605073D|nr:cyclopropane-fatty-acyl-phospholipid synthase-like [Folsomia candida]